MAYRILNSIMWILLMLLSVGLIILFIYFAYYFYQPEINLIWHKAPNPFFLVLRSYPFWVYLIVCFTVLSIIFVCIFIASSLYYSAVRKRTSKLKLKYTRLFTAFLSDLFLTDKYQTVNDKTHFFRIHKRYFRTRIQIATFIDTYLQFQETIAVNLSENFLNLITLFNLHQKIETYLYHRDTDDRILAMKILSYLRINTHNQKIIEYAESENIALRTEAYAALIRLMDSGEHLTNFIGEKHSLSILDFNIIVNAVLKNNKMNIDYRALLASKQTRKNMIGLILAKYKYRRNRNNLTLIINHIDSDDEYKRQLAWEALLTLVPEEDAVDLIIDEFEKQTDDSKLTILKNSQNIINPQFLSYLQSVIGNQSLLVKIEIMRILYDNDINLLSSLENSEDEEIRMAYNEISNIYLLM